MNELVSGFEVRDAAEDERHPDLLQSGIKKIGAVVSYNGAVFSGFVVQPSRRTVAGELLRAMELCLGESPKLTVAGRTDSGVHARAQVVSFSVSGKCRYAPERFIKSMNSLLDHAVSVRTSWIAPDDFDARFSARWRRYRYRFVYGHTPDPFEDLVSWRIRERLDVARMIAASQVLLGEHDFSSFCKKDPNGASLTRRLDEVSIEESSSCVDLWITASSFCHQMVRSIAGLLYQVGVSKVDADYVGHALRERDRAKVTLLAPPNGLILWEVGYDAGAVPAWS